MRKTSLSTGDLAKYCQVTSATIVNWIRAGKLDVYSTPGGQYRMELSKFRDFLITNGFPIPDELQERREKRVLVIDDDPDMVTLFADAISALAPAVRAYTAANGIDGLIEVGRLKPDLISLDLDMPHIDGVELCRRLRSNAETKDIPVVVVTGLPIDSEPTGAASGLGVKVLLQKPVDIEQYVAVIRQYCGF
jgi:excisionase family DNA binding protein